VIRTLYYSIRIFPYLLKHLMGRWHVFRDAPTWLVSEVSKIGSSEDSDVQAFIDTARAELVLRMRKTRQELDALLTRMTAP
jgi:hypothetical protein